MAEDLGEAVLELSTDNTALDKGLDAGKASAEELTKSFTGAADLIKDAFAAIGIGMSLNEVLKATIEAEHESALLANAVRATGAAAGYTTEQLKAQQVVLQQLTGVGDEAISSMQRTLMSFRNVHGQVFRDTIQLSLDFAAATGTDATDAARKFGMALNDPINSMGKLKMAGVAISDTLKKQVEGYVASGDLVGAQTLLINELSKAYGGAAVASRDTLGGAINALKENFGNLFLEQEGAGKQLRVFIELVNSSLPTVAAVFSAVFSTIKNQVEGVVTNLFYLGEGLNNLVHGRLDAAISSFGELVSPVKIAASSVAAGVLAYEESATSITGMTAASDKLAAAATVNAGIVTQSAQDMATALNASRLAEETKNAALAASAATDFKFFQQHSAIKTAAITAADLTEVAAVQQKYAAMAAEADLFYLQEATKLANSAMEHNAYTDSLLALAQSREARMAAIQTAGSAAMAKVEAAQNVARLNASASFFSNMSSLLASSLGENNAIAKTFAVAAATVQAFVAWGNTYAMTSLMFPPPVPSIMAGVALAAGLANAAKIGGLADGGPMSAGQTSWVGERGPELFTAPRAGHIIPNHEIGADGQGVQVTNNINVSGIDFSNETIAERILNSIADAAKRGTAAAIPAANAFSELSLAYSGRTA